LLATGDLPAGAPREGAYDDQLHQAVQRFQARHGLETDGIVGAKTLAALNVSVNQRLGTMVANLIRLQRQHRDWGGRYIAVNIPAAAYRLVVDRHIVFERPAVVGRPSWPTPILDSVIDRVEFHPYWHIPMKIAEQEVWPKQDADPSYFARNGIYVVDGNLLQDPGPLNPLGAVKFVFDNPYSVYLHDTTAPALFDRESRFFSHGCIRVSDAGDLARQLLATNPQWSAQAIDQALRGAGNQTVAMNVPIPLHIVYDTAWVEEDGIVQFRDDIYHRDVIPASVIAPNGPGPMANASDVRTNASGCG
jgi:murein L,D-transpeptidase YcbB/YkuD